MRKDEGQGTKDGAPLLARRRRRSGRARGVPTARLAWGSGALLAVVAISIVAIRPLRWWALQRGLDARAAIPWVTPENLVQELGSPTPPLVLDVRPDSEFAVGHLPGALRVDPDADAEALADTLAADSLDRPVVLYCSVGARSGTLGKRLAAAGLDVRNLRGGAFRWAADGRPLLTADGAPTDRVHPYDRLWGRYLPAANRAQVK